MIAVRLCLVAAILFCPCAIGIGGGSGGKWQRRQNKTPLSRYDKPYSRPNQQIEAPRNRSTRKKA
jgi:hypothetical protein